MGGELASAEFVDSLLSADNHLLTVGSASIDNAVFDNLRLRVIGGIEEFAYVTFMNMALSAIQLDIDHPGNEEPFELRNVRFLTTPVGGRYVRATDTLSDSDTLQIEMICSDPIDGSAFEQEVSGAVIDWLPCVEPTRTPTPLNTPTQVPTVTPTP